MFRREVLEEKRRKLHGEVFLVQPPSVIATTFIIFLMFSIAAAVLLTGSYTRSERINGYLVPSKGIVKISANQFGTLRKIFVEEGINVQAGQPLAEIHVSSTNLDGASIAERNLEALKHQRVAIDSQIALELRQLEIELAKLHSEKQEVELHKSYLSNQLQLQSQITESAKTAYDDVQGILAKGYISKIESERRKQAWLGQKMQEQLKKLELANTTAKLEQLAIRLEQLPIESEQRQTKLKAQLSELDARKANQEERDAYLVTSSVAGRIASLSSGSVGHSIRAGQTLLTIIPTGGRLEAELFVPSRAAGFIQVGQDVKLIYDAFPYQRFGYHSAIVKQITETILAPNETLTPFDVQEPVYRVTAALIKDHIDINGREIALQSGMSLQANIVLERRSLLDWLLDPLRSANSL